MTATLKIQFGGKNGPHLNSDGGEQLYPLADAEVEFSIYDDARTIRLGPGRVDHWKTHEAQLDSLLMLRHLAAGLAQSLGCEFVSIHFDESLVNADFTRSQRQEAEARCPVVA